MAFGANYGFVNGVLLTRDLYKKNPNSAVCEYGLVNEAIPVQMSMVASYSLFSGMAFPVHMPFFVLFLLSKGQ